MFLNSFRRIGAALVLAGIALPTTLHAQSTPAITVPPIAFTDRTLTNGLKVIASRATATPNNRVNRLTGNVGGSRNASTWFDRTNYPQYLETMLWTRAERMARPAIDENSYDTLPNRRPGIASGVLAATAATARSDAPLRVMSFNIRVPIDKEPGKSWETRRAVAIAMIRRAAPDIIGTQELHKRQGDDIVARLPDYNWIGVDRRGGKDDEYMALFYRRDRLTLLNHGNFWLSDTPDVPGSRTWGNLYPRMVTWGLFETKAGKRRFYAYNTHLPYRAEDEAAREKGAALIAARLAALPADMPAVLTGDFNTEPASATHGLLSRTLSDAWLAAPVRRGPAETFHNFTGKADRRIDWIFVRGFAVRRAATLTDHHGTVQTSDHFPVVAELGWR